MKRLTVCALTGLCVLVACAVLVRAPAEGLTDEDLEVLYDQDLHASLATDRLTGLADLAGRFADDQFLYLWITPPNPDFLLFQPGGLFPVLDLEAFPDSFIDGLSGYFDDGIRKFPIWVYEDAESPGREIVVENMDGEEIARIDREWDYSPEWYVRERYPKSDTYEAWYQDWLLDCYDPARIFMRYDLILGEDDLVKYVLKESLQAAGAEDEGGGGMAASWAGGSVSNFQFVAAERTTNDTIELTIAWPDGGLSTNRVDFFACTNLVAPDWCIAATTNVDLNTNCFSWADGGSTNHAVRFYDCWTLYDGDSDGLSDGREVRIWGTDPEDWDSDDDGLPDGVDAYPTNYDTSAIVFELTYPTNGTVIP